MNTKQKVLLTATELFFTKGYSHTTIREISKLTGLSLGSITNAVGSKDELLSILITSILESYFEVIHSIADKVTEDKLLYYAYERAVLLYISEKDSRINELLLNAYTLPSSTHIINMIIVGKLKDIFIKYNSSLDERDFFEKEIANSGITRSFLSTPCTVYFSIERKIKAFLESSFLIFNVPKEEYLRAIDFVNRIDYESVLKIINDSMMNIIKLNLE